MVATIAIISANSNKLKTHMPDPSTTIGIAIALGVLLAGITLVDWMTAL